MNTTNTYFRNIYTPRHTGWPSETWIPTQPQHVLKAWTIYRGWKKHTRNITLTAATARKSTYTQRRGHKGKCNCSFSSACECKPGLAVNGLRANRLCKSGVCASARLVWGHNIYQKTSCICDIPMIVICLCQKLGESWLMAFETKNTKNQAK